MTFRLGILAACLTALLTAGCQQSGGPPRGHSYSTVLPVALGDWQPGANTAGQTGFVVDLAVPQIDQSVVDGGGVAVYYRFKGSERYEPLPLVFNGVIYHAYHSKGVLSLRMFSANGGNLGARPPSEVSDLEAKVVVF
ncbi:MAG TPA: hypothetical protein VKP60_20230 [Magnetospirillaceae bacterium]|nr:hypothetical protein [Magnetospirillaceae bacterium]